MPAATAFTPASARSIRAMCTGRFQKLRKIAVVVLLGMFYLFPWLRWDGRQAVLFDLPARKFHVFGLTFWPQDFVFLAMLLIMAALSLFFFTAHGRPPVVRLRLPADGVDRGVPAGWSAGPKATAASA